MNIQKMSHAGIEWLKQLEGAVKINGRHVIYDDATGRPVPAGVARPHGATIGYGHLVKSGEDFSTGITEDQATEILLRDIATAERDVQKYVLVNITQNQYDALVALVYNIGGANFKKSTVLRYINNPDFISRQYKTMADAWCAWNKCRGHVLPGLNNRRKREWDLFKNGRY